MIHAITFDLDDTLMNFKRMKHRSVDAALEAMINEGLDIGIEEARQVLEDIYDQHHIENQRIFDILLERTQGKVDYAILAAGILAYRKTKEGLVVPYPGVHKTLTDIHGQGIKMAIVSDAPVLQAWTRLVQLNLHHYFQTVVTFDDTGERKPSPKPYLVALKQLDVDPRNALHVGDWPDRDIKGAQDLGMKTAWAQYGSIAESSNADYTLARISDLVEIVKKENAA